MEREIEIDIWRIPTIHLIMSNCFTLFKFLVVEQDSDLLRRELLKCRKSLSIFVLEGNQLIVIGL